MRVILDTNVLVSALIVDGKPRKPLKDILTGNHTLVLSDPIVEELSSVVSDRKVGRYVTEDE